MTNSIRQHEESGSIQATHPLEVATSQPPSFRHIDFIAGDDAIQQSGLVRLHVAALQSIAMRYKTILMFRPVNRLSTGLLQANGVAKGMHIKAKTSDWGPMAGFIPSDQGLSKKWQAWLNKSPGNHLQPEKTESVETSVFVEPLRLSADRLMTLSSPEFNCIVLPDGWMTIGMNDMIAVGIPNRDASQANPGDHFEFRLTATVLGKYEVIYRRKSNAQNVNPEWQSLKVLNAYRGISKDRPPEHIDEYDLGPITADYDAFAYLPHISTMPLFGQPKFSVANTDAPVQTTPITRKERFRRAVRHIQRRHLGQQDRYFQKPNIGREPAWQAEIRNNLNTAFWNPAGQFVRHATEMDNVVAPEKDDHIFIVTPDEDYYLTRDWEQVQAAFYIASEQGFTTYFNRSYQRPLSETGNNIPFDPRGAYLRQIANG